MDVNTIWRYKTKLPLDVRKFYCDKCCDNRYQRLIDMELQIAIAKNRATNEFYTDYAFRCSSCLGLWTFRIATAMTSIEEI